ncbi:putative GTP-binding protein 6 [Asterias amurensis]|uniref:putative GTP-binding protein 6 n=1 Tax=Asterias amurensis TaxID=7602 RepID=UPI003AB3F473
MSAVRKLLSVTSAEVRNIPWSTVFCRQHAPLTRCLNSSASLQSHRCLVTLNAAIFPLFQISTTPNASQFPSLVSASSFHSSRCQKKKHVTKKLKGQDSLPSKRRSQDEDDGSSSDFESDWEAILSQEDPIKDIDPPPLGGHRFFVLQPDLRRGHGAKRHTHPDMQLEEAIALVETIPDWTVVDSLVQAVKDPAKKFVFGKGTFAELTKIIRSRLEITGVFLSIDRLSGVQQRELEDAWGVQVFDRYAVVLKIFKDHARTREAQMQIALAEIPYLRSRLRRQNDNMDQQRGGHSFISGGGETFLSVQQRVLKEREQKVRKALDQLKMKRSLLRGGRARRNFPIVSVVGYTNAGKTTLIKSLTGDATMQPKDQLFATLDVTAHGGTLPNRMPVIYMDTVGFISDLPHSLVASFAATLEDVLLSDIIVHVRDVSHPDTVAQKVKVLQVLAELGVPETLMDNIVEVCNKVDKVEGAIDEELVESGLQTSAETGSGLDKLKDCLQKRILETTDITGCQLEIPMSSPHLSWLYKEATVTSTEEGDDADMQMMKVNAIMSVSAFAKFIAKFGDLRTTVVEKS